MQTKTHSNKLQKSSGLFLPLGLVLTLLTVYGLLETKTTVASSIPKDIQAEKIDPYDFAQQREIKVEKLKIEDNPKVVKEKLKDIIDEIEVSDNPETIESELFPTIVDKEAPNPSGHMLEGLVDVPVDEDIVENVPFDIIEDAPIFPGCEKQKDKVERKACFSKKLSKFIGKKINADLAMGLGLPSGKQKIWVQFTITKTGGIKIDAVRAGHPRLEKEGKRVINLLPRMIPGKQRKVPVNVKYILPIILQVE